MNCKFKVFQISLLIVFGFFYPDYLLSLSCNSRIISIGDTKSEVYSKCGLTVVNNKWKIKEEIKKTYMVERYNGRYRKLLSSKRESRYFDEMIYNFGSNRLIHMLQFKNNKLSKIITGGYGYDKKKLGNINDIDLEKRRVAIGDTKLDVLMKYGKPFTKSTDLIQISEDKFIDKFGKIPIRWDRKKRKKYRIVIEHTFRTYKNTESWKYDFGPNRLIQVITFGNGRVTGIHSESYGNYQKY